MEELMLTKPTRLFCQEWRTSDKATLWDFFPSQMQVRMCMDERLPNPIVEVEVSQGQDMPDSYWAWWDIAGQRWTMVFPNKKLVEICFPYGSKAEEDRGRGKLLPVKIFRL